jgi:hypothetical protein
MFKFYKPECFIPDISTALSSNYQITKFEKLSILISAQWGGGGGEEIDKILRRLVG